MLLLRLLYHIFSNKTIEIKYFRRDLNIFLSIVLKKGKQGGKINAIIYEKSDRMKRIFLFIILFAVCCGLLSCAPEAHVHSFSEWSTESAPTCLKGGSEIRRCSCGWLERRETEAKGHAYSDGVCTVCGESEQTGELEFTSNGDGTCVLSGIGTFSGTALVIPTHSPDGDLVTSIGVGAFSGHSEIQSVEFEEQSKCESIGERAFENCSGISKIKLPQGLKRIEGYAFIYCTGLKSASLPASVSEIGSSAFSYCTALSLIGFEGTCEQWDSVSKGYYWYYGGKVSCTVRCSDGDLSV